MHNSDLEAEEILSGIESKVKSDHNYIYVGYRQIEILRSSRIANDRLTFTADGRMLIFINSICLEILTVDTDNHLNVG
jgi:predicted SPOUT superfamily RNA methylase MTH1